MSDLKPLPCPFCGGINIINCGLHKYCHSCGAEGPDADNGTDAGLLSAWNRRAQPAHAMPLLSDDEIDAIQRQTNAAYYAGTLKDRDHSRAIEQAVRAKPGVAVPMADEQIDAMATACKYTFHATMIDHRALARAVERHHGIVGEKGGA